MSGRIKMFIFEKGYGFITSDTGDDLFFHATGIRFEESMIQPGMRVSFKTGPGRDGRPRAYNVTPLEEQ
jgi:cold shock protein